MYIKGQHRTTAVSEYLAGLQNLSESSKIAHHSCRCPPPLWWAQSKTPGQCTAHQCSGARGARAGLKSYNMFLKIKGVPSPCTLATIYNIPLIFMINIIFSHILANIQNIHDIHFAYLNIVNLLVNMTRIPQALNAPKWSFSFRFIFTSYSPHILTKYDAYSLHIHVLFMIFTSCS
mgnify:CR=1 FL=1